MVASYITDLQSRNPGYARKVVPYNVHALVYNLVSSPIHSVAVAPITCAGHTCSSYLLTGGLPLTTPVAPPLRPEADIIRLQNVTSKHVEFEAIRAPTFEPNECVDFSDGGQDSIVTRLCLKHDSEDVEVLDCCEST